MIKINISGSLAALGEIPSLGKNHQGAMINITGLTTETIKLTGFIDGIETNAICVRKEDGTFAQASALGNGLYYFDIFFDKLKLTKSAGADAVIVLIALREFKAI